MSKARGERKEETRDKETEWEGHAIMRTVSNDSLFN